MTHIVRFYFKITRILASGFFMLLLTIAEVFCQTSKDMDRKKQDNIQQLNYSKTLLEKTAQSKNLTLNQLNLIQNNIELRSAIIDNISEELVFLKSDISTNNAEIRKIEGKITAIKKDYANLIIGASRNLDNEYAMMYIFSSQDINQAYQRIKYLKYLAKYRMELAIKFTNEEENLKLINIDLTSNRKKNEELLIERTKELISLDKDKKQNILLIRSLQNRESELKREIQKRERIQAEIEKEIRKIIAEEAERAREARRSSLLTAEENIISTDFSKNIGRLPWPTEQGILTGKFGEQNHPIVKSIKIRSNGIDINTVPGAKVRSVFDGEVTKIIAILGANYTVIIKHGNYRTVYQNLVDVRIKAGDKVKTKTIIGTVFTDNDNVSKFHFEIWKDKDTQNPELWLSK
jgi:septal ring factor EnvC (AmiA/AmiB activator)